MKRRQHIKLTNVHNNFTNTPPSGQTQQRHKKKHHDGQHRETAIDIHEANDTLAHSHSSGPRHTGYNVTPATKPNTEKRLEKMQKYCFGSKSTCVNKLAAIFNTTTQHNYVQSFHRKLVSKEI